MLLLRLLLQKPLTDNNAVIASTAAVAAEASVMRASQWLTLRN